MENAEKTVRLPSRVKWIIGIALAVIVLAIGGVIGWYVIHFRNYTGYKSIPQPPRPYTEGSEFVPLQDEMKAVPGFVLAAENDAMALYLKETTAEIAVLDKQSGKVIFSNPQDSDKDPVAKATNLENLKSQFILSYLDGNAKEGTAWSSYAKSVANGQVSYESIDNGIRVIYSLSNERIMLVPDQLTPEWFAVISEAGRKQAAKSYVLSEESGLYEIKTQGVTARNRQQIDADAREAGFTMADYEEMQALRTAEEDEQEAAETLSFTVTLDWTLTPDGVQAAIPYEGLGEFGNGQIRAIQLLPFFGAAGAQETGNLVVPEGSGAMIHFNNGKSASPQYNKNIYDLDLVDSDFTATQNQQTARLALFGICREDSSILATCERGASLASITADVSGCNNSYNYAYFTFALRHTDNADSAAGLFHGGIRLCPIPVCVEKAAVWLRRCHDRGAAEYHPVPTVHDLPLFWRRGQYDQPAQDALAHDHPVHVWLRSGLRTVHLYLQSVFLRSSQGDRGSCAGGRRRGLVHLFSHHAAQRRACSDYCGGVFHRVAVQRFLLCQHIQHLRFPDSHQTAGFADQSDRQRRKNPHHQRTAAVL